MSAIAEVKAQLVAEIALRQDVLKSLQVLFPDAAQPAVGVPIRRIVASEPRNTQITRKANGGLGSQVLDVCVDLKAPFTWRDVFAACKRKGLPVQEKRLMQMCCWFAKKGKLERVSDVGKPPGYALPAPREATARSKAMLEDIHRELEAKKASE